MKENVQSSIKSGYPRLVIEALFLRAKGNYGFREFFLNILNYLIEHRDDLHYSTVILVTGERAVTVLPKASYQVFEVVTLPVEHPWQVYWEQNKLAKRFHLSPDDVIMFTSDVSAIVKSCKHLLVIHDWLYLRKDYMPNKLFRIQRRLFVPRGARLADKIITISEWVKKDVLEHSQLSPNKIVPIYNFLDFDKYSQGVASSDFIDFCNSNKYFLAVSSGARHKNLMSLLKAYKEYRRKTKNEIKKLVLVGSFTSDAKNFLDQQEQDLQKDIYQLHNISNRDLGLLYEKASAYISTTLFEGFGMPIAEAMYFMIPVIVSNIEVVREITSDRAVYFDPADYTQLANLMNSVDEIRPANDAREVVQQKFSKANTVAKYLDVINSMNNI